MHARSVWFSLSASLLAVGIFLGGCSDDDDGNVQQPTAGPAETPAGGGAVTSNSSVAPNTFLTFEGDRYRLESLEQANLAPDDGEYTEVGTASEADIDQADLTVFRREGEPDAVYTYADARGAVKKRHRHSGIDGLLNPKGLRSGHGTASR